MKKILFCLLLLFFGLESSAQTISEKEVFSTEFKGNIDLYNFIIDSLTGTYCYAYFMEDDKKYFIISNNSMSEKYDVVNVSEAVFDSKGNYYTVTANYKEDYGIDNYFVIANGKTVLNFDYIDSYNAGINNADEYVFIFKQFDKYKIGYYSIKKGLRQSEPYDMVKAIYNLDLSPPLEEEGGGRREKEDFYTDENGERGFVAITDGKAKLIFETKEILTNYSDINEASLTKNKNSALSFIAKKNGRFYESVGNEFVVSGGIEYNSFMKVNPPVLFNERNEPVYVAGDSLGENIYDNYIVIGNVKEQAYMRDNRSMKTPRFDYGITDLKVDKESISYFGTEEIIIPAHKSQPNEEVYDQYYSRTFLIKNGAADELGYNTGKVIYFKDGQILYSGISDLTKKDYLLMQSNGISKIILNKKMYNEIYDYGISPGGEIYYVGQNYEDTVNNTKFESHLYFGDNLVGKYEYLVIQYMNNTSSVLKFDSRNNYAYIAGEKFDSISSKDFVYTNNGKLPIPKTNAGIIKKFNYIWGLMYSKSDKLFYIAEFKKDEDKYEMEMFADNVSMGKPYDLIGELNYNEGTDQLKFFALRENKIYSVTIKF